MVNIYSTKVEELRKFLSYKKALVKSSSESRELERQDPAMSSGKLVFSMRAFIMKQLLQIPVK